MLPRMTWIAMAVVSLMSGCATDSLFSWKTDRFPKTDAKNPVSKILTMWQPAEGPGVDGLTTRGFMGQVYFLDSKSQVPAQVTGAVRVYLFDDQGPKEEQAKPIHQFDFPEDSWKIRLQKTKMGPAYVVFVPYTRPGLHRAKCSLRMRFTTAAGEVVYSDMTHMMLPGTTPEEPQEQVIASPLVEEELVTPAGGAIGTTRTPVQQQTAQRQTHTAAMQTRANHTSKSGASGVRVSENLAAAARPERHLRGPQPEMADDVRLTARAAGNVSQQALDAVLEQHLNRLQQEQSARPPVQINRAEQARILAEVRRQERERGWEMDEDEYYASSGRTQGMRAHPEVTDSETDGETDHDTASEYAERSMPAAIRQAAYQADAEPVRGSRSRTRSHRNAEEPELAAGRRSAHPFDAADEDDELDAETVVAEPRRSSHARGMSRSLPSERGREADRFRSLSRRQPGNAPDRSGKVDEESESDLRGQQDGSWIAEEDLTESEPEPRLGRSDSSSPRDEGTDWTSLRGRKGPPGSGRLAGRGSLSRKPEASGSDVEEEQRFTESEDRRYAPSGSEMRPKRVIEQSESDHGRGRLDEEEIQEEEELAEYDIRHSGNQPRTRVAAARF